MQQLTSIFIIVARAQAVRVNAYVTIILFFYLKVLFLS